MVRQPETDWFVGAAVRLPRQQRNSETHFSCPRTPGQQSKPCFLTSQIRARTLVEGMGSIPSPSHRHHRQEGL